MGVHVIDVQWVGGGHEWKITPVFHMNFINEVTKTAECGHDMQRLADM